MTRTPPPATKCNRFKYKYLCPPGILRASLQKMTRLLSLEIRIHGAFCLSQAGLSPASHGCFSVVPLRASHGSSNRKTSARPRRRLRTAASQHLPRIVNQISDGLKQPGDRASISIAAGAREVKYVDSYSAFMTMPVIASSSLSGNRNDSKKNCSPCRFARRFVMPAKR